MDQKIRAQLQNVRADGAYHELLDLRDARAVHVGGKQQEDQAGVQHDGLDAVLCTQKSVLNAEAHGVKRARMSKQRVRQYTDAGSVGDNA